MIDCLIVTLNHDAARPLDMVNLLETTSNAIEAQYNTAAKGKPLMQPFLVQGIIINVEQGTAMVFLEWQSGESTPT
jgi:hypothetical protein